ncbi:DHH family phosphoesterase [Patescibacteria group bacterium]|nr:DHH family phosphoesterase [Patescibacteria group bacterium]
MPKEIQIKNLKKAAERIKKAVKDKERIILYGDSDLDGETSVIILKESIQNLGGEVSAVFFPDRESDGYGITKKAIEELKDLSPALFISMDLGISSFAEVEIAESMGFEVIIIDHHQPLNGLPKASIIVAPKQESDKSTFKNFANVGLIFKLSEILLGKNMSQSLRNSFLELTALGTLADMMPIVDENKIFIENGLDSLGNTFRPGLRAFFEIFGDNIQSQNNLQKIIGALNTCKRVGRVNETYLLLISSSLEDSKKIAQRLIENSQGKQFRIKEIIREVENRVESKTLEPIIFEGDSFWSLILAGSVASTISQRYEKPTFIFKKGDTESCGSVRVPKNVNSVDAMATCADLLITYGGHPPASGFRIKNENLEKFKSCLIEYFKKK